MTSIELAALIAKNNAATRKIAEQSSLAFIRMGDRRVAAIADISRLIDPSVFAVTARLQETLASSSAGTLDRQITEITQRAVQAYDVTAWQRKLALNISRWPLAQLEASIGAYLKYIDDIPRRLGADVLASLNTFNRRQWEMLQDAVLPRMNEMVAPASAAAAAAGMVDDLVLDDFMDTDVVELIETDGDNQGPPLVLTRFQVMVIAYVMTLAIWFFSLGNEGLTKEHLQQDMHTFALGVLGALAILLLNPPNEN